MSNGWQPWPYGTRKQADAPDYILVTSDDFLNILGDWTNFLAPIAKSFPVTVVNVEEMCQNEPETYGEITPNEWLQFVLDPGTHRDFYQKLVARYRRGAWLGYCEYIPAPDPVIEPEPEPEPPPPPDPPPVGFPTPPDSEWSLDEIGHLLTLVWNEVLQVHDVVDRIETDSAWLVRHTTGLTPSVVDSWQRSGSGSQVCGPCEGFLVEVLSRPPEIGESPSPMPTLFDLGYFSYGTLDGQERYVRLTRERQLFYPAGFIARRFTWELRPGVTIEVSALLTDKHRWIEFGG